MEGAVASARAWMFLGGGRDNVKKNGKGSGIKEGKHHSAALYMGSPVPNQALGKRFKRIHREAERAKGALLRRSGLSKGRRGGGEGEAAYREGG